MSDQQLTATGRPAARESHNVVIGVGNHFRHDDALGLEMVERLDGLLPRGWATLHSSGEITSLLSALAAAHRVILIDAICCGGVPGTVRRFDAAAAPLPAEGDGPVAHTVPVTNAVELARALGLLPPQLTVYGMEGADYSIGEGLSAPVARALPTMVAAIVAEARRGVPAQEARETTHSKALLEVSNTACAE